ncbi:MAG: biopolymer transporter ExbD [Nitrospinae bacterium]|nr:biopolymer transporter ExbD [Nitrospinota bacterium]
MRFKSREEDDYSLQLAPLIDVVFLLLIFFMVSTAFVDFTRRMDIELPESRSASGADREKVWEIEITREGAIFLTGAPVTLAELASLVEAPRAETRASAIIRADRRVDYGTVVEVMGALRAKSVRDISIAVK